MTRYKYLTLAPVPIRPDCKTEILLLQSALLIASMPRIIERMQFIDDPLENEMMLEHLSMSSAIFARTTAGYGVEKIADDLGRSIATVQAYMRGYSYAYEIIKSVYEEMIADADKKAGYGAIIISASRFKYDVSGPIKLGCSIKRITEYIKRLEIENIELRQRIIQLEKQLAYYKKALNKISKALSELQGI